ncbi:MAG: hypothetical protein IKQ44_05090 [Lachnospiraceae bacterium]|nr:hypothetical protein [Lachnospiraceae bacterium]
MNKRIKAYFEKVKNDLVVDRLNAIEWVVLGLVLLLITVSLFYGDNLGMFLTYFWVNDSFLHSASIRFLGNNQLPYGIVQQLFGSFWTFPVNLIHLIFDFDVACVPAVIWYKLSMSFIMTCCMKEMLKLADILEIDKERRKWMLILLCSSILVALPVFHIAQTDILYAYFSLVGMRYYFKEDTKRFILFFALAISCKVIALIVFIPLILLREKRILYIFRDSILGVAILFIERIWYRLIDKIDMLITGRAASITLQKTEIADDVAITTEKTLNQVNTDFAYHFFNKMLFFEFPAIRKGYVASVMVFVFALLCIWCYVQKKDDIKIFRHNSIYAMAVAWMIFFINASPSPYWIVAMFPSWFLLIFMNHECIKTNLLLHNVFTLSMFLVYLINTYWVYGGTTNLDYLLLKGLIKVEHTSEDGPYVARYLNNLGLDSRMNIIVAICLASAVALIAINHNKIRVDDGLDTTSERKLMHGFAIWQIGILAVWYAVNVWVVQRW